MERQITGHGLEFVVAKLIPPTKKKSKPQGIPVLISQPAGVDLHQVHKQDIAQQKDSLAGLQQELDSRSYDLKFLVSVLCGHCDMQPANEAKQVFQQSPKRQKVCLVSIDSDHAFQDAIIEEEMFFSFLNKKKVNRMNILYCFDRMKTKALHPQAIDEFLSLDPIKVVIYMVKMATRYENQTIADRDAPNGALFTRDEVVMFLTGDHKDQIKGRDDCYLLNGLKPDGIYEFIVRFHALQLALHLMRKEQLEILPFSLLKLFEREVGRCYEIVLAYPLPPIDRYKLVQDTDPEKTTELEHKAPKTQHIRTAQLSGFIKPTAIKSTAVGFSSAHLEDSTKEKMSEDEKLNRLISYIKIFNKNEKNKQINNVLDKAMTQYGSHHEYRYAVVTRIKSDLERGITERFFTICQYPSLSYLIELILKKLNVKRMGQNLGAERSKAIQEKILDVCIKYKHYFYELHLKNWTGLTESLLIKLIEHSKKTLEILNLCHCSQLNDSVINTIVEKCPNITSLNLANCIHLTEKSIRAVANFKKLLRLDLSGLINLQSIGQIGVSDRIFGSTSFVFPELEDICLNGCVNLRCFNTKMPRLKIISFKPYEREDLLTLIKNVAQDSKILKLHSIYSAVLKGDFEKTQCLLQLGAAVGDEGFPTALMSAAESGNYAIVKLLIENGAQINKSVFGANPLRLSAGKHFNIVKLLIENHANVNDGDPLGVALSNGQLNIAKLLIENGAVVNSKKRAIQSDFRTAVWNGYFNIVEFLIEKGAKVNKADEYGEFVLMLAVEKGHLTVVQILLEKVAEIDAKDKDGKTALILAVEKGYLSIVQILIEKGNAKVSQTNKYGRTLLELAVKKGHLNIVDILIEKGAEVDAKGEYKRTALTLAVENGHHDIVQLLIEKGAKANETYRGKTVLMLAVENGHHGIVQLLIEKGAKANETYEYGKTVLMLAVEKRHLNIVGLLIEKGAEIGAKDEYEKTALILAVEKGSHRIVQLLIEKGANANEINKYGESILMLAVENEYLGVVQLLIEKGAEIDAKGRYGKTALRLAVKNGYPQIVQLLIEKGANVNETNRFDEPILMLAVEEKHLSVVQILIEKGAEIDAQDECGKTALMLAIEKGYFSIVNILLKKGAKVDIKKSYDETAFSLASCNPNPIFKAILTIYTQPVVQAEIKVSKDSRRKSDPAVTLFFNGGPFVQPCLAQNKQKIPDAKHVERRNSL